MKLLTLNTAILCAVLLTGKHLSAQTINKKLAGELAMIYKDDQKYRVASIKAVKQYGVNSRQDFEMMNKQQTVDLANLRKVERIFATYGYPGKSLVNTQSKVAFIVVQHNGVEAQEKYMPLFLKAAESGELDYTLLPLMIDRIRTAKGQPQLYGTQLSERKNTPIRIYPIEDEKNVNIRRKSAGLSPIESYYEKWDIKYTVPDENGNPNPKELYVDTAQVSESVVEAIGGDQSILSNISYPDKARNKNISGSVLLQFTVDTTGKTKNIKVIEGLGYGCDEEAVKAIVKARYINNTGEDAELRMKIPFPYKDE